MTLPQKPAVASPQARTKFRTRLLAWYGSQRRDLPWRKDRDPYRVWLSEVMLQQTRVAAVIDHYQRFLRRFPTLEKLAAARESSVLAAWSGLGYYRRARMLHAAAKEIVREHGGRFPGSAEGLRTLPGIGRYTAAAVASIAFDEAVAVVDGNVERVLGRLLGQNLAGEKLWQAAQEFLERERPGDFNQAMMELGATVCRPRQPICAECPVEALCATRGERRGTSKKAKQQKREVHYALDCREGAVWLRKRPREESLMPGMWELPEISGRRRDGQAWLTLRHSITVTDYIVRVRRGRVTAPSSGVWVAKSRLATLPLTGLAQKILRAAEVI